jgi:hypothetical protein
LLVSFEEEEVGVFGEMFAGIDLKKFEVGREDGVV